MIILLVLTQVYEVGAIIIPILQIRGQTQSGEVTADEWWS